jgi:hypothetical protein
MSSHALSYAWSCLACEAANPASSTRCERCDCAACATRTQIDAARAALQVSERARPSSFDIVAALKAFRVLLLAGGILALLGVMTLLASTSAAVTAFGGLLLALAALCVSSYRWPASAPA